MLLEGDEQVNYLKNKGIAADDSPIPGPSESDMG